MKKYFLVSLLSIYSVFSLSQNSELASKNHYTFSLVNSLNRSSSKLVLGDKTPENVYGVAHGLNFHYTRILTSKFSLTAGIGFGFLPINMKVQSFENYPGTESWGYFSRISYKGFTKYELLTSYHKVLNQKYSIKFNLGVGLNQYGGSSHGFSYGSYDLISQTNLESCSFDIQFTNSAKPYLTFGTEVAKNLRNKDIVSLKLMFDYSFKNAYSGTYSIYDKTSKGEYYNRGNYFNLGLAYTITGNKRLNRINQLKSESSVDKKSARRLVRKENRFIDPRSTFVNISGGIGIGMTKVENDPGNILEKHGYPSFLPRISVEKGYKKNFYGEIGLHSQLFWDVSKFSFDKYGSAGFDAFYAVQLSLGGVYRVITKNNYNIINVHAGLTTGYHFEKNGENGLYSWGGGSCNGNFNGQQISFKYENESTIKLPILSSMYLGLSKDFRIVNNFYFTLNYRQQFGLLKVSETTYNYNGTNIPTIEGAKTKINGSSKDFQIGIKLKLRNK